MLLQSSLLRHLVITSTKERNMEIAEVIFLTLLSNRQRKKIGAGFWLFDDSNYWDFTRKELSPLLEYFQANLL